MARKAPAVERAIAVLNLLASRPSDRFTLSEIARECELNKATLHAILGELTRAGYVVRDDARKSYGLGPALVALGNAAAGANSALDIALPEMQSLTDELGLDCVASSVIGDEIVILARTGTPRPFGIDIRPGHRLPLAPPLGTVFVAWSPEADIDRWLGRLGPRATKADLARYRRAVTTVRERGYSVGLEPPARTQSVEELRDREYALVELDQADSYRLNHIGVPIFGALGDVVLALFLIGFVDQIPAEQVPRYASRLMEAAAAVTSALGGRGPAASAIV